MFYKCLKCKKTWQYPIKKCPDCFLELEQRPLAKQAKVIGISKVNIPSLLHPKIPYFVLVLEDSEKNRWTQKSMKEYKIGDIVEYESSKDKNAVAVWRVKYDVLSAVEKVVELIGGLEINSKTKILILPTLISPKHPYLANNTNPIFLDGLIRYLKKIGAETKNIKVAAQSFDETSIDASAQKSQLLDVCNRYQIILLDLAKSNFFKKKEGKFTFEISEQVFNNDLIINLPILKIDSQLGLKGATENTLKFLKKESFLSLKYFFSLEEIMEKLPGVLPTCLTIADGSTVQNSAGLTTFLGITLASFNQLNLDRVFAEIVMLKNLTGSLKEINMKNIPITGRKVEELQYEINFF